MELEEQKKMFKEIQDKISESCKINKYSHLCNRMQTDSGLAWVTNRCIKMMANDSIHLSAALAYLENELEGVS